MLSLQLMLSELIVKVKNELFGMYVKVKSKLFEMNTIDIVCEKDLQTK